MESLVEGFAVQGAVAEGMAVLEPAELVRATVCFSGLDLAVCGACAEGFLVSSFCFLWDCGAF